MRLSHISLACKREFKFTGLINIFLISVFVDTHFTLMQLLYSISNEIRVDNKS
jgi:hypothetical protein